VVRQTNHIAILTILWTGVHTLLLEHYGIRNFEDSIIYLQAAEFLASHGYLADPDQIFYSIPIACIAVFRLLTEDPSVFFIAFQCVISVLATLALYRTATTLYANSLAGFITACLYLTWWDTIHWNTTVMTESLAGSMICFLMYSLVHFQGSRRDHVSVALWTLCSLLTRPTGVVIVLSVLFFFIVRSEKRAASIDLWFVVSGIALISVLLLGAQYLFTRWDFTDQYRRGNIITYADVVKGSSLHYPLMQLDDPVRMPDTDQPGLLRMALFVLYNPWYFFKAMVLKIVFLLSGIRPYYTILHNVYSLSWNIMIYIFFIMGCRAATRRDIVTVVVGAMVLNCLLVGISSVDWDNRFLAPMVPGLVLIAGGGMVALVKRVTTINL